METEKKRNIERIAELINKKQNIDIEIEKLVKSAFPLGDRATFRKNGHEINCIVLDYSFMAKRLWIKSQTGKACWVDLFWFIQ